MKVGQYELTSLLGSGGMGEVWRAVDPALARNVAVKILPPALAANPEYHARFLREARLAARLNHPHIATIYSVEEHASAMILVMELVDGTSLDNLIARGPLAEGRAVEIVLQAAAAIGAAHDCGIVHRDIKPQNIMTSPRGVKVLDFGIAREIGPRQHRPLTLAGTIMGTPHYMSPEQAQGHTLDGRSDIFSLGVVFYELLSGAKPFDGETATEVLRQVVSCPPPLLRVRPELAVIVGRCLAKHPGDRFQTAEQLANALRHLTSKDPPERDPSLEPTLVLTPVTRKALVADDDPVVRRVIRATLESLGYEVDEAADGADAVRLLKTNTYAALVTDLMMPRLDGWSVLDFVRATPARRPAKIVVASTLEELKLSGVERAIVSAVVTKPIAVDQLRRHLA